MIESIAGITNMNNITNANKIISTKNDTQVGKTEIGEGNEFSSVFSKALEEVEAAEMAVTNDTTEMLTGESVDLHTSMINLEKADIALRLTMQVRNKVIDAYKEVMRMQF